MKYWSGLALHKKIFVMLLLGIVVGWVAGPKAEILQPLGDVFIRLLRMLIVPLVFFTLSSGVTKMGSPSNLRRVGGFVVTYYLLSSLLAAAVGCAVALVIRPGIGAEGILGTVGEIKAASYSVVASILNWIPTNPVEAMANANMLQIIFFSLIVGIALLLLDKKTENFRRFLQEGAEVMIQITDFVMKFAPYGIFALVAILVGTIGDKMMSAVLKFILADYIAVGIVLLVIYPPILRFFSVPVLRFFRHIFPAMLVAATTTSSAATLPVSMQVAEEKLGLPEPIYGFALPLGNTVNMNGMAVAIGVIAVFALDLFQVSITPGLLFQIVYLGLLLSIGAAGVKGAGIVMSTVLLETLGLPLSLIPILAAIWPIIDIAHTTANITGDLVGSTVCASRLGQLDRSVFDSD
ncbi:dicarboxylate/amino acid:cation symporter [uncultured Fretibacterium sp.]|uniref:dicarboxylate/amino acid:cation symporter n=1 Tax=uncultured Fretibacterium sp. TaxID=1678694 RepID=UPI0026109268|nr:dicarboxylate/amino acid:cation symporter [uncultured Fretibacterium sp.]